MLENALRMMLYSRDKRIPLKFIKMEGNTIIDKTDDLGEDLLLFYTTNKFTIDDVILLYCHKNSEKSDQELSDKISQFLGYIKEQNRIAEFSASLMASKKRGLDERWEGLMETTEKRLERMTKIKDFFDELPLTNENKESVINSFSEDNVVKRIDVEYTKFNLDTNSAKYLFNEFKTNENLFYIEYVDDKGKSLIKLHESADKDEIKIYDKVPNHIYFRYTERREIIDIVFSIENMNVKYSYYSGKYPEQVKQIVNSIFSDFKISEEKTLFTTGSFNLDIKNFSDFSFYYFIMIMINLLNKDGANLIFMKETSNPRSLKKRSKYYFRDLMNLNHIDYVMSFTVDNIMSNLYSVKYRAKNKDINFIKEVAILLKKYMMYYEKNSISEDGQYFSEYFLKSFYGETFQYEDRSYSRIPNKITNLRNKAKSDKMFPGGGEYTKKLCECKLQPVIIDAEDIDEWERYEDFNTKGMKISHKTMLFPPENSSQGPKKYYVCPTHKYPMPVLKPNTGINSKQYPYLPCCKLTGKNAIYDSYEEVRLANKGPVISIKQSEIQSRSLPIKLQKFFKSIVDEPVEIKPVEVDVNDSLISSLLLATKGYRPPFRKDIKDPDKIQNIIEFYKKNHTKVSEFRKIALSLGVKLSTIKQEMFDYDDTDIADILSGTEYVDSMMFFRFFEELFHITIAVVLDVDGEAVLEKPRYKNFHVRNIKKEFPTVFLYRDSSSSNGRYSCIGGKNFRFRVDIQPLIQPYYRNDIEGNKMITRINPYRGIIWEKIFKNFTIVSQRIDNDGKMYTLNIKLEDRLVSVYVPPSAPLNVSISNEIFKTTSSFAEKHFMEGQLGSYGVWYKINGMKKIFLPCTDIQSEGDMCSMYIKDEFSNKSISNLKKHTTKYKNSKILCELFEWMWRVSNMTVDEWFDRYIKNIDDQQTLFEKIPLNISFILPKYTSTNDCIRWIRNLNPEYENVFGENINLYSELRDNMFLYMKRIELSSEGIQLEPIYYLKSNLSTIKDYEVAKDEMLFDNLGKLDDWINYKFHDVQIYDTLENRGSYIYQSDKGMFFVKNTSTINEAMLISVFWIKNKKFEDPNNITFRLLSKVIELYGYTIYDKEMNELKKVKKNANIDVVKYESGIYSTLLKIF